MRLLPVGNHPESSSLPLHCSTMTLVFTLMLEALLLLSVRGVYVEQSPPAPTPQEGASSTLWCNFSTFADSVWWYLQKPGGRLIHLIYIPSGTRQEGRLNATAVPKERRSSLHISSLWTTDSGTYFCAVWHNAPQAPAA
uniref:Ig-like domain-containing protein n=1 Tax=Capra hircus TaxID=9925 RepID=A0A8C2PC82_CAPHI